MEYLYTLFSVIILFFLLVKKKNISLIVLYFFSTLVYYYNAYVGVIFHGKINGTVTTSYEISQGTYIVLFINFFIIIISLLLERENVDLKQKKMLKGELYVIRWMIIITFILGLYLSYKYHIFSLQTQFNKTELMKESGRVEAYFKYIASFVFVYIFTQTSYNYKKLYKILAVVSLVLTFLFGHRSYIVISILAIVFDKIYNECLKYSSFKKYIIKNKKIIIMMGLFFALVLIIKGVSGALFNGDWNLFYSRLTNLNYYSQVFKVSEPNTIIKNLDTIVINDFKIPYSSYLIILTYIVPGISNLFHIENFTYVYQRELYASGVTNQASTYLGEAYANGGYIMVFVIVLIQIIVLAMLFRGYLKSKNNVSKTFFLISGIDIAFYSHRNSLSFEATRIRAYLYIALTIYLMICFIRSYVREKSK